MCNSCSLFYMQSIPKRRVPGKNQSNIKHSNCSNSHIQLCYVVCVLIKLEDPKNK